MINMGMLWPVIRGNANKLRRGNNVQFASFGASEEGYIRVLVWTEQVKGDVTLAYFNELVSIMRAPEFPAAVLDSTPHCVLGDKQLLREQNWSGSDRQEQELPQTERMIYKHG